MPAIGGRPTPKPAGGQPTGLTSTQKRVAGLIILLVGPSMVKKWMEKPAAEKVDLSSFNIVTHYDKPAIEKMDSTLRIEFCAS